MQTDMISFRLKGQFNRTVTTRCYDGLLSSANCGVRLEPREVCLHAYRVFKWKLGEGIIVNYVVFWVIGFEEYLYGFSFQTHSIRPLGDVIRYVIRFVKATCGQFMKA